VEKKKGSPFTKNMGIRCRYSANSPLRIPHFQVTKTEGYSGHWSGRAGKKKAGFLFSPGLRTEGGSSFLGKEQEEYRTLSPRGEEGLKLSVIPVGGGVRDREGSAERAEIIPTQQEKEFDLLDT